MLVKYIAYTINTRTRYSEHNIYRSIGVFIIIRIDSLSIRGKGSGGHTGFTFYFFFFTEDNTFYV